MPELDLEQALRDLPHPSFKHRLRERMQPQTLTPYIVVRQVDAVIDFAKEVFDAQELLRTTGSAGGTHCELRIGDSKVIVGGGEKIDHDAMPTMLHVYVRDVDAMYRRAIAAGATSVMAPVDQEYGDRDCTVQDAGGNFWCIATSRGPAHKPEMLRDVTLYLHPHRVPDLIDFMARAVGSETLERYASPDGSTVVHAKIKVGNTVVEMGEAHGQWTPQPTMIYLLVGEADAAFERAIAAGGKAIMPPADQPYGARLAGVEDFAGNHWYLASPLA